MENLKRQIKSYLYDFINYKYINNSNLVNFKQKYLKLIKQKSSIKEVQDFIEKEFFNKILDYFNEEWQKIIGIKLSDNLLKNLIKDFEKKVWDDFIFRYYQYLTILNTYFIFLIIDDKTFQDDFLKWFKEYLKNYNIELWLKKFDLKRLNYWMATWSWKTYLMYFILELYYEIFYKSKEKNIDNIFLIIPAWLREQHKKELYNIYKINFNEHIEWSETTFLSTLFNTNIILTSSSWLNNIIFKKQVNLNIWSHIFIYDEWHKWAWWDRNTEEIKKTIIENNNNFIFDYSATFQEVIKCEINDNKSYKIKINTLNNYFSSSIYNYNLTFFQNDWYWKKIYYEFWNTLNEENKDNKEITKNNLKNALLKFNLQLKDFSNLEKEQNITEKFFKPLFLWVSNEIWNWKEWEEQKNNLIDVIKNLVDLYKDKDLLGIFEDSKDKVKFEIWNEEILITFWNIKWLIYTWSNWIKKIWNELLKIKELVNISETHNNWEFKNLDNRDDIIFLFWSKKFIEWWDSKRPSTIFLLKWAKTSTIQAVQLLWRWLRLSWYNWDWFRHNEESNKIKELEKLYLIWQDTNSLKNFLENSIDTCVKIIKYYKTTPKDWLNNLKLPYLKTIEKDKSDFIKINLNKSNIKNNYIEILNQKISFNNEYYKKSKRLNNWEIFINNIDKNKDKININYLVLDKEFINIVSDFNSNINNKVIYNIDIDFFKELYSKISFYQNVWMNLNEKKIFIKTIIKNILNSIIHKLNKEISFEIKYINNNDKDISFDYYVWLKHEKQDWNKIFWLELKEDKKYSNIIEIRNNNFWDWFNLDDDKNINIYQELYDKIKKLDNKREQNKQLLNELDILINKNIITESEWDELSSIDNLEEKIENLKNQRNNKLKGIFDKSFDIWWKKEHLYKRLYHFYNKESSWLEKDFDWLTILKNEKNIKKENIEIYPNSILILNNYEAEIINQIINDYKSIYEEIHFFRNPPNWEKYFIYKNKDWLISKFYPDFIFWFIKNNEIDVLYLDPKWNDEDKEWKVNCFKTLNKYFWKNIFKNKKLWNNNILWFDKIDNHFENLNNLNKIWLTENIKSISWVIVSI